MSDEQDRLQPKGGVRRVGKDNRKKKLKSKPLVFPPDSAPPHTPEPETPDETVLDIESPDDQPVDEVVEDEVAEEEHDAGETAAEKVSDEAEVVAEEELKNVAESTPAKPTSLPPEHARFAPPNIQTEAPIDLTEEPDLDDEDDIPTTRIQVPKVVTPPAERFPPVAPPRDLPPAVTPVATVKAPHQPKPQTQHSRGSRIMANLFSVLVFLVVGGIVAYGVFILQNPYSALNPFPPPTPFPVIITATFLPPTETTTPTFTPFAVSAADDTMMTEEVQAPAATLDSQFVTPTLPGSASLTGDDLLTATPSTVNGGALVTFTPSPGASPLPTESPFAFEKLGEALYIPNGNGRGCEWSSIAGTAVDLNGEPINGLGVRFTNQITQEENTVFTGSSATFGEGGFEFIISTAPVVNGYTVQLLSPAGAQLSDTHTVVSSDKCDQNVAIINFEQRKPY